MLIAQSVIEKQGQTLSFITFINQKGENFSDYAQKNPVLNEIVEIMKVNK